MRLVKLSVQRFQCIEEAEVDFGPGLNVLFGPNDLGKSSLAWAIRAVLLLQHNSSHHERFVSWYGAGEPRVALTFTDAENRYWKVTKTFGGSAGRSLLETSKDGRSFSADCHGRQVDERLRKLLGWGVAAPGAGRGFPDSFLAQVLLSEQDNVRQVLFDTSLTKDADESGRQRLVEALDALAQDPLFKKILDDAQEYVSKAFTPTGRKKKAAGSPFVETTERIRSMQRDIEALEARVRDTSAAELRIGELIRLRDDTARQLGDAQTELRQLEDSLVLSRRRAALREEIAVRQQRVDAAASLQAEIPRAEQERASMEETFTRQARRIQELTELVAGNLAEQKAARERLDAAMVDAEGERARQALEEQLRSQRDQVHAAKADIDRCIERERSAVAIASALTTSQQELATLSASAAEAEAARNALTGAAEKTAAQLEEAKQRLREATSQDKAQARELRRAELENQRLARVAQQTTALALKRRLDEADALGQRLEKSRAACEAHKRSLAAAQPAVEATREAFDKIQASEDRLLLVQALAEERAAAAELDAALNTADRETRERATILSLRDDAARVRAAMRSDLPAASKVTELRRLAEDLRVANARLGGGLSISLRPRKELAIAARVDGTPRDPVRSAEPLSFTAETSVALSVDGVLDLEIVAGEESARAEAATLSARWSREGDALLAQVGVRSLDDLDALLQSSLEALRRAEEAEREALAIEQRLGGQPVRDLQPLRERVQKLEAQLAGADRQVLSDQLGKLGAQWSNALTQHRDALAKERKSLAEQIETQRALVTRTQTQLEAEANALGSLEQEHTQKRAELPGEPRQLSAGVADELASVERDLTTLSEQLAQLTGGSDEASTAREAVARAERALAEARAAADIASEEATRRRDELLQAQARRAAVKERARELDTEGTWRDALEDRGIPDLAPWRDATRRAQSNHDERDEARKRLEAAIAETAIRKNAAIQNAKTALDRADRLVIDTQASVSSAADAQRRLQEAITGKRLAIAELKTKLAGFHVEGLQAEIAKLAADLAALPGDDRVDEELVERHRSALKLLEARSSDAIQELAKARGALEQVGGAIVREQKRELEEAKAREERREHEIEVEYDAWKLLVDTMRETETTKGAHLGRALAGPVTQRFRELTENRYGSLELGPHLEAMGLQAAGQTRDFAVLSAGTQDQLATLLRLCVAEQLESGIVLDDHLSQSDPKRVAWFNSILRASAHQIQITFITCRPGELLTDGEMPAATEHMRMSAAGSVRAIDLSKVIRRFAAAPAEPRAPMSRTDVFNARLERES